MTIAVLFFEDVDDGSGTSSEVRPFEQMEYEIDHLLAPHCRSTLLTTTLPTFEGGRTRTVPNYRGRFDFWCVDPYFYRSHEQKLAGKVIQKVFQGEYGEGVGVLRAADLLPVDFGFEAVVDPYGQYHNFFMRPGDPGEVIAEYRHCLAVICDVHI